MTGGGGCWEVKGRRRMCGEGEEDEKKEEEEEEER